MNNVKVGLIAEPSDYDLINLQPLGLLSLASTIRDGHEVEVIDCIANRQKTHDVIKRLGKFDVVGLSCLCTVNTNKVLKFAKAIKERYPNIILISIDDLRADHLGCYGYQRNTSPYIDSFAKNNILFERCYTHEPWTTTAHLSMLTSLYPITHGVDINNYPLHPAFLTLTEVLKNEGYFTMGFVNNIFVSPVGGFTQGFDYYIFKETYCPWELNRNAEYQNMFIKNYLHKHRKKMFFLFIHYFDVHSDTGNLPYNAPPPYDKLFSANYDGNLDERLKGKSASKYLAVLNKKQKKLSKKDIKYIISLYDNGIAYMDQCIGDLFKTFQEMNVFDNSLIILTADHGEGFQEHGWMLHGNPYYYEEQMHVPLIVKLPKENSYSKTGGKRIESLVEIIDIMPSIFDYLHINISDFKLQGKSFLNMLNYNAGEKNYIFGFGSDKLGDGPKDNLMVRSERWKLISDGGLKEARFKLFDLGSDPKEQKNLANKRLDIKNELAGRLIEEIEESKNLRTRTLYENILPIFRKSQKDNPCEELFSGLAKERLEALGYIE